eukprot:6174685-Pleurochrysis_carterae.AAC.1
MGDCKARARARAGSGAGSMRDIVAVECRRARASEGSCDDWARTCVQFCARLHRSPHACLHLSFTLCISFTLARAHRHGVTLPLQHHVAACAASTLRHSTSLCPISRLTGRP